MPQDASEEQDGTVGLKIASLINDEGGLALDTASTEDIVQAFREVAALSVTALAESAAAMQSIYGSLQMMAELNEAIVSRLDA